MCGKSISYESVICWGTCRKDQSDCGRNLFRTRLKTSAQHALTFTGAISSFYLPEGLRKEKTEFFFLDMCLWCF